MLKSDLSDYSDAYIVVKRKITATNPNNNPYDKKLTFKNNAPFGCDLLEYSKNYRKTTESLWNYYRDEPNIGAVRNINYSIKYLKCFDYKTSITGKLEDNNVEKDDVEILVPLNYLSNFWRTLDVPLIVNSKLV